jgi:hypothetical protein
MFPPSPPLRGLPYPTPPQPPGGGLRDRHADQAAQSAGIALIPLPPTHPHPSPPSTSPQAVAYETAMLTKLRESAGIEETADMRLAAREREERANKYDGFDMNVRGGVLDLWQGASGVGRPAAGRPGANPPPHSPRGPPQTPRRRPPAANFPPADREALDREAAGEDD